jgi:phosphoglycerate dehydrogenase-like enzyme
MGGFEGKRGNSDSNGFKTPRACFLLRRDVLPEVYAPETLRRIRERADVADVVVDTDHWRDFREILAGCEVIFSGWSAPLMDREFLNTAPNLRAIFYAAGSIRYFVTPEMWSRGIRVTSAYAMNGIPVSEYTVGAILLALKRFWHFSRETRKLRSFPIRRTVTGAYGARVGLVSYGTIARLVRERLRLFDVEVLVYDPLLTPEEAEAEMVTRHSMKALFAQSDVVSVHAPVLKETVRSIGKEHFDLLRPSATLINTARGQVLKEEELVAFLRDRPDVQAILDVSDPEPPVKDSPLYDLPNVALTPHIAGSLGRECHRMGAAMADEYERYLAGKPLEWELTEDRVAVMA